MAQPDEGAGAAAPEVETQEFAAVDAVSRGPGGAAAVLEPLRAARRGRRGRPRGPAAEPADRGHAEQDGTDADLDAVDALDALDASGADPLDSLPAASAADGAGEPDGAREAECGRDSGGASDADGAGDALSDSELARAVAALVYASPEPISERRLQTLLAGPRLERVRAALDALRERLAASGLPYALHALAGGWQILTTPDVGEVVARLAKVRKAERISGAALETLAVVAYRQPVTKAEIEAIRGVQAGPILRTLVERGLVRVSGRADVPGHPLQYGTTREFLDRFGLASLDDLPRDGELARD